MMINLWARKWTLFCMNSEQGCVNPSWDRLCAPHWPSLSPPITWLVMVWTFSPLLLLDRHGCPLKLSPELISSVPRIAVTWTCDQLDWFSLIIITFVDINSTITRTYERESKLTLVYAATVSTFPAIFLGCLGLFSNPHLSVLRECSPWVCLRSYGLASRLAIKRTIWSE